MKRFFKVSALLIALVMLITLTACNEEAETKTPEEKAEAASTLWDLAYYTEDTELGEGVNTITVKVTAEEKSVVFTIHTDAGNLADAMMTHSLVSGDESQYGLYIKTVNGIRADYELDDGYYWSITKNGEMLMTGAESEIISDGAQYEFIRTK